jgi:uncharacterized protein YydD (DUF2326 family)
VVRHVYEEASSYLPLLQDDWERLADFVDALKERKLDYLLSRLPETQQMADDLRRQITDITKMEAEALVPIRDELVSTDFISLRENLRNDYIRLGGLEEAAKDFSNLHSQYEATELLLNKTQEKLDAGKAKLQKHIEIFNKYFTKLSQLLYEEKYLLHFDEEKSGAFKFGIAHVGSNVGTGKKASQTAAFDLAYIQFLNEIQLSFPKFALHDGLESIHHNQLTSLLLEAAQSDGQFVIATLRGKLPELDDEFIKENTIIELSQNDKLFRF